MQLKLPTEFQSPKEIVSMWNEFRNEVKTLLSSITEKQLLEKPTGRWSLSEVGEHLYLSQMNLARSIPIVLVGKFGESTNEQRDLDYEKIQSYFLKPSGVKNPDSVTPLNQYLQKELFDLLDKSQKKLEDVTKNRTKEELQKRGMEHPYFGVLNLFNFLWVMGLHEYSHLVAIRTRISSL